MVCLSDRGLWGAGCKNFDLISDFCYDIFTYCSVVYYKDHFGSVLGVIPLVSSVHVLFVVFHLLHAPC